MNKSGFSLIELMVVMMISSLMFGVGYVSYREYAQRQAAFVAKRELLGDLRSAQKNVISGNKIGGCKTSPELLYYRFSIDTSDPSTYKIVVWCKDPLGGADISVDYETKSLGSNITLTSTIDPIDFKPFTLGTNIPNEATITIDPDGDGPIATVVINSTGEIK